MRALPLLIALAACADFPEVDALESAAARNAPFPALLPTAAFEGGPAPRLSPATGAALEGRIAALRARAAALRGPVLTAADRARLRR